MPFPFASPDRLLARFVRTGDARALGKLFDQTAPELLRLAAWLSGNRADAEDLLQRTFLTVLTKQGGYDPARRAMPWLCGILGNHAKKLHEQRQVRAAAAPLPAVSANDDPVRDAADAEFAAAVVRVRAELGSPYAEVLDLHLAEGLDAKRIAERLGRPAGTVRTQIVRGLELLRRHLPHGFVAGLGLGASVQAASLAVVRAAVMVQANATPAVSASAIAAGAGGTVMTFGGMVMGKKLVWLVPALLSMVGGGAFWWLQQQAEAPAPQMPAPAVVAAVPDVSPPRATTASANAPAPRAEREAAIAPDVPLAEPGSATLVVRIRWADDQSPAVNVGVLAKPQPGGLLAEREALTDARGTATLRGLLPGKCRLSSSFTASQDLELAAATVTTLDLEAVRSGIIDGLVVDAEQRPIADARLWMSLGGSPFRGFEVGRSDARGRFRVPFVPSQDLGARKAGFAPSPLVGLTKGSREVTLVLAAAGGTIRGRVVDTHGLPVPGARVEVGPPGGWSHPASTLLERLLEPVAAKLVADAAGAFSCEGVAAGNVDVQAWAAGFGPTSAQVAVTAGHSSDVTVVLLPGAVVTGTVRDAAGQPVPGATVTRVGKYYEFARPRTDSGADGTFRLVDLPTDAVTLSAVSATGGIEATLTTGAGTTTTWDPVIPAEPAALRGHVVDAAGRPLAKLRVGIVPPGLPHVNPQTTTDAEGSFTLRRVDPGTQTLQVELDQVCLARREITVPPATPLVVTLSADEMPTAHLRGRVVDEAGAGIAASLILRLPSWRWAPATDADVDGTFHRGPLPAGDYLVGVAARGFGSTHLGVVSVRVGEDRTLPDIVLRRAGTVELQITGDEPTRGTTVQIARRDGVITTWVMPDGRRATAELPPGEYLAVLHDGASRAAATFVVRSGETTTATLTFVAAIAVTVTCPREGATPNELLQLAVHDASGALLDCALLHPGIEPAEWRTLLPPGPCTATVRALDDRTATTSFTVRIERDAQSFVLALPPR